MKWLVLLLAAFAITASAAGISGTWKGTADTPAGSVERTFVFKVDGAKLTGETSSQMFGKSQIEDGKIDGENLSFVITASFQGNEVKISYKGKVSGDSIKLTVAVPGLGQTIEYTIKRAA